MIKGKRIYDPRRNKPELYEFPWLFRHNKVFNLNLFKAIKPTRAEEQIDMQCLGLEHIIYPPEM